jgi:hypothetical protein
VRLLRKGLHDLSGILAEALDLGDGIRLVAIDQSTTERHNVDTDGDRERDNIRSNLQKLSEHAGFFLLGLAGWNYPGI